MLVSGRLSGIRRRRISDGIPPPSGIRTGSLATTPRRFADRIERFDSEHDMPTLPTRAAAYTRTGILKRFLEELSHTDPGRVDNAFAESRMGLKGGDVRAFLQSLRVLGLIDP